MITQLGPLRDGLKSDVAADLVWVLIDPGLYHQLVIERGWEPSTFSSWLATTMHAQLLAHPA